MADLLDEALGLSLKSEQLGFGHMAARAAVMYVALIVLVRFAKKRFLGQATAFDYILVVLIGAVAGRAMTGGAPYFASLFGLLCWWQCTGYSPPHRDVRKHSALSSKGTQRLSSGTARPIREKWQRRTCQTMIWTRTFERRASTFRGPRGKVGAQRQTVGDQKMKRAAFSYTG